MKKTVSIILSLILAIGLIVGVSISAYAEESEVFRLPDVTVNDETHLTLEKMGISDLVNQIRERFPLTIEQKYENGVLSVPNMQATSVHYLSFFDYNAHEMTLIDGYWTIEMEESEYGNEFGLIRYYGTDEEWEAVYRRGEMECVTISFSQDTTRTIQIYPSYTVFSYINSDDLLVTNEYDKDGALTINSVRFDSYDLTVATNYKPNKEFDYSEILINDSWCFYLHDQGWSNVYNEYQPIDTPEGWEYIDEEYILNLTPCTIPCEHTEWTDETKTVCASCGTEFANINGERYEVMGDVTDTGLELLGTDSPTTLCYKAGEGYVVTKLEKHDAKIILYNATIDVSELAYKYGIYSTIQNIEYLIYGTNNVYGNNKYTFFSSGGSSESSEITMTGIDDGVLNIYGEYHGNNLIINSGVVNVYNINDSASIRVAVDLQKKLTINEGATLTAVSSGETLGIDIGVLAQRGIENNGTLNATYLTGIQTDTELIYNIIFSGEVVLSSDLFNLFLGEEITEGMTVEFNIIVLEGASITVPEGITLDLDSMTNVDVKGEIIVNGALICTHEGGEATCTKGAICDICKTVYTDALGHSYEFTITDPDCVNNGYTTYTCTVCGDSYKDEETEAHGHDFNDATTEAPKTCKTCGETEGEKLPHDAHTPSEPVENDVEQSGWFVRIINKILDFFRKLFSFGKKK